MAAHFPCPHTHSPRSVHVTRAAAAVSLSYRNRILNGIDVVNKAKKKQNGRKKYTVKVATAAAASE